MNLKYILARLAIAIGVFICACSIASQYVVWWYRLTPSLGEPGFQLFGVPVYYPWSIFGWYSAYSASDPIPFATAVFIISFGLLAGAFLARLIVANEKDGISDINTFGSAKWASSRDIKQAGLYSGRGVVLGRDPRKNILTYDGPSHTIVIAPTRSGKGAGVIIPSLLNWPGSVLVFDLKGENYAKTAGYRSRFSEVKYLDFASTSSASKNPLDEIRKGKLETADVQNIADMIVDPDGTGRDNDHWARTGHSLLTAAILHCLYDKEQEASLAGVVNFLSDPGRNLAETLKHMLEFQHTPKGPHPVVARSARDMLNKAENEKSGVLSTALSFLTLYRDPIVAQNTRSSDFMMQDLMEAQHPRSVYLAVSPANISRLRPLNRLFFNQAFRRLTEKHTNPRVKHDLLIVLDEFTALHRMDFFEAGLAYFAGYRIHCLIAVQATSQLFKAYGTNTSILGNCRTRILHTPTTTETAEQISKMLGRQTVTTRNHSVSGGRLSAYLPNISHSHNETGRPLLTVGEVLTFPEDEQIIFVAGKPPIRSKKIRYFEEREFKPRLMTAPIVQEREVEAPKQLEKPMSTDEGEKRDKALAVASQQLEPPEAVIEKVSPEQKSDELNQPITLKSDADQTYTNLLEHGIDAVS